MWLIGLRIWCCHCSGSGCCCVVSSIPGQATSACHSCSTPQKITHKLLAGKFFFFYFFFQGLTCKYMQVPWLGFESELQLPASITATTMLDLSCVCDLYHSSGQHQIHDPVSESRDRTRTFMDTSWICFC